MLEIECDREGRPVYSDGTREAQLFDILLRHSEDPKSSEWMSQVVGKDFVFEYHLSPTRHNLLKWFPFAAGGSLLDVGCGCGALTGLFAKKLAKVTALEYSPRRARIAALRHREARNLQVYVGGLQDFAPTERFDYISMIGVLEYAPTFFTGLNPQSAFVRRAAQLLLPDGALIIAIENKIGLKYICGSPEDHTNILFDSIYGYPRSKGVRTFSRKELAELLQAEGFHAIEWYYPLPDYKLPQFVFSDDVAPHDSDRAWEVCAHHAMGSRREIISEKSFGRTLARAGLFHEFANSFLVVARREPLGAGGVRCLKFNGSNLARKPQFKLDSLVLEEGGERWVLKQPATIEASEFVRDIAEREQRAVQFFGAAAWVVTGKVEDQGIRYPLLALPTLEELIVEHLQAGSATDVDALLERYVQFVRRLPSSTQYPEAFFGAFRIPTRDVSKAYVCLKAGPVDLIPANILVSPEGWHLLDHEWFFDFPIPVEFVLYRGFATLTTNAQDVIQAHAHENPVALVSGYGRNRTYMPMRWWKMIDHGVIPLRTMSYWNWCFQARVLETDAPHRTRLRPNPRPVHDVTTPYEAIVARLGRRIANERLRGSKLIRRFKSKVNGMLLRFGS